MLMSSLDSHAVYPEYSCCVRDTACPVHSRTPPTISVGIVWGWLVESAFGVSSSSPIFSFPGTRLRPAGLRPRKPASAGKSGSRPRRRKSSRHCPRRKRPRNKVLPLFSVHSGLGNCIDHLFNKRQASICLPLCFQSLQWGLHFLQDQN